MGSSRALAGSRRRSRRGVAAGRAFFTFAWGIALLSAPLSGRAQENSSRAAVVDAAPASGGAASKPHSTEPLAPVPADLPALLLGMRSATGVIAQFTETKELALLTAPLVATGVLYFVPPDRLVRVVTSPGNSRLLVDGDQVRLEDSGVRRTLDLTSSPIARQMIDSFVVLFNGDEKRLKELYSATYEAGVGTWSLHLAPRSMPLNRMISAFHLYGTGPRIDRMEAVEPDGDRTVTIFGQTEIDHHFDAKELAILFAEPPAS